MIINSLQSDQLAYADRTIHYGDGCFTTIKISNGIARLLSRHIQRLQTDCQRLHIGFEQWQRLAQILEQEAEQHTLAVLKVLISRGEGGRGYSPPTTAHPKAILSVHPFPTDYAQWQQAGIELGVAELELSQQPQLAGIKHLNRLEQVLVKQQLATMSYDDLLVLDQQQQVIEASAANVFWYCNDSWFTPDLDKSGVSGVMRNYILDVLRANGVKITVGNYGLKAVQQAQALCITNSLMEIVPVKALSLPNGEEVRFSITKINELQLLVKGNDSV